MHGDVVGRRILYELRADLHGSVQYEGSHPVGGKGGLSAALRRDDDLLAPLSETAAPVRDMKDQSLVVRREQPLGPFVLRLRFVGR